MNEGEVIRHENFCQFKAEVRSSRDYLIVGIDVAKERHHAFFGTASGRWRGRSFKIQLWIPISLNENINSSSQ